MGRMKKYPMSKSRLCILAVVLMTLLILLSPATVLVEGSETGTISGQVINNTEGGGSVAGMEVTLTTYVDGIADEDKTEKDTTDGDGKFQFADVDTENQYLVSVEYMEVTYYSEEIIVFEDGETAVDVEVNVCDATDSDEYVTVEQAHIIISAITTEEDTSAEEDYLLVTQIFVLANDGDMTYVGTDGDGVLVFILPQGAVISQLSEEFELLDNNRIAYLVPFPPGEMELSYYYTLPGLSANGSTISLQVDYPTSVLDLMVGGEDIEVAVTNLAPEDPITTGAGEQFIHFGGEDLPSGTVMNIYLSESSGGGGTLLVILCAIIGVVVAGIAAYSVRRIVKRERK